MKWYFIDCIIKHPYIQFPHSTLNITLCALQNSKYSALGIIIALLVVLTVSVVTYCLWYLLYIIYYLIIIYQYQCSNVSYSSCVCVSVAKLCQHIAFGVCVS